MRRIFLHPSVLKTPIPEPGQTKAMTDSTENDLQQRGFWASLAAFFSRKAASPSLRESLEEAIEEHEDHPAEQDLDDSEKRMLLNILEYGDKRVDDIMVPRADIVATDIDCGKEDVLQLVAEEAHSRMPVFRDTLDTVVGMIHVKDLVKALSDGVSDQDFTLAALQRPVLFVPASMRIRDLLAKMRARRIHMAIVVDEYGGTDGLATIEDVVEQIVGEIEDEHDDEEELVLHTTDSGQIHADARVEIEALEALIGLDLRSADEVEDVDTLGGLVFALAGRVPDIGEMIAHPSGYSFEVVDADPRRIRKVRVHETAELPSIAGTKAEPAA